MQDAAGQFSEGAADHWLIENESRQIGHVPSPLIVHRCVTHSAATIRKFQGDRRKPHSETHASPARRLATLTERFHG
jgi:hypothetical protein